MVIDIKSKIFCRPIKNQIKIESANYFMKNKQKLIKQRKNEKKSIY